MTMRALTFCWGIALTLAVANAADSPAKLKLAGAPIVVAENAPTPTRKAAEELAKTLQAITGVASVIQKEAIGRAIVLGGRTDLRDEEISIQCDGARLTLAGGGSRGDFYAVSRFLEEECGVRWWTPWASAIPKNPELAIGALDRRESPAFETREPFWYPAFDPAWAMRNGANGQSAHIPAELGGCVQYKGFVHTFYPLVPPEKYFGEHPEWYSLIKGKRTHDRAQLCLTNPKLREFLAERVKQWLRESPEARIVSVSQNDWYGACECDNCKALDDREGSHSGTMLDVVNFVAEQIEKEFPNVSVDTLAYQYTRKPPKTIRPRKNVIVRLCSIECNFREPLEHSSNATFADDIRGWEAIADRLYIWDYTTDFGHYVQPHPNWFTLGANVRFFSNHHVRGLFEQGAYQSHGSEMSELRAWVLAQLLWNPKQDDRKLIREFLEGYYGAASDPIYDYLNFMSDASKGYYLGCFSNVKAIFLNSQNLSRAEKIWAKAEAAVQNDPELLARVRIAHLPLTYVWLARWDDLRKEAADSEMKWPLADSKQTVADEFLKITKGQPDKPWTQVTRLNEGGLTPEAFVKRITSN